MNIHNLHWHLLIFCFRDIQIAPCPPTSTKLLEINISNPSKGNLYSLFVLPIYEKYNIYNSNTSKLYIWIETYL